MPPSAFDALTGVPVSMGLLNPPADIIPHPSGAGVSDLTSPEHQYEPPAWGPELSPQLRGLVSIGGAYYPGEPSGTSQVCCSFSITL